MIEIMRRPEALTLTANNKNKTKQIKKLNKYTHPNHFYFIKENAFYGIASVCNGCLIMLVSHAVPTMASRVLAR